MKKTVYPFKVDHCYAALDISGMATTDVPGVSGFFFHDTRHLSAYSWDMSGLDLIHTSQSSDGLTQFWSRFANHEQQLLIRRKIGFRPDGFDEELSIQNSGRVTRNFIPKLTFCADFLDVFELRGTQRISRRNNVEKTTDGNVISYHYLALDGVKLRTDIAIYGPELGKKLEITAGENQKIRVSVTFTSSMFAAPSKQPVINWASVEKAEQSSQKNVLNQAREDIQTLAISTESGTCIGAGIPNFVVMFGRDSLISAWFLLKEAPELAKGVLKFLAKHQGKQNNTFHDEQPGKILHEFREGELSRLKELPFAPYFGSVDTTPLFLRVLADYVRLSGDTDLAIALEPNWRSALGWIEGQKDSRGFLRYTGAQDGKGLINKCWKDSNDSMSYSDGSLGEGALAIVEVQGYLCAAYESAAYLNQVVAGEPSQSERFISLKNSTLKAIDRHFWMEDKKTYALALDNEGNRLDVVSSNPGHLLWSGAVAKDKIDLLVNRMFEEDLWAGWGLRTLSSGENRFNPLSYHNGSIWPHDTALFGAGLYRYGRSEFNQITDALTDLANMQQDQRLPELVGGYHRDSNIPPLPYVESCRPQAWAAAALIYMLHPHWTQNFDARSVAAV